MKASVIALLGLTAGTAHAAPPGPVAPPPPLMVAVAPPNIELNREAIMAERQRILSFDVEVRAGRDVLWIGTLNTSAGTAGNYNQSKREPSGACADKSSDAARYFPRQNELRVSLDRRYGNDDQDRFNISVNWVRPIDGCDDGQGNRTVGFTQGFLLAPGQARDLAGDGGLTVRLTRRR